MNFTYFSSKVARRGDDGGGTYLDEMYESWCRDPTSVHASWNAYFSGSTYTAPPTVGNTKANEVPLSAIGKSE